MNKDYFRKFINKTWVDLELDLQKTIPWISISIGKNNKVFIIVGYLNNDNTMPVIAETGLKLILNKVSDNNYNEILIEDVN